MGKFFFSLKLHYFSLVICLILIMSYKFCSQGKMLSINTVSNVMHAGSQLLLGDLASQPKQSCTYYLSGPSSHCYSSYQEKQTKRRLV